MYFSFFTLNRDWYPRLSLWELGLDPGYMEGSEAGQIALIIRQACEFPELECFNPTGQPYMTVLLVVSYFHGIHLLLLSSKNSCFFKSLVFFG